nr:MFS transporter [Actinopolyspora mortivallis]
MFPGRGVAGGERRSGPFPSLRVRNFRLYAAGQVVSLSGTWIQRIAQDWLVLEVSGGSAVALGLAVSLQFLPMPLLTLWAGVLADRLDKRRLLIWLQYGVGTCALALGSLELSGFVQLWQVYLLCLGLGCCSALEMPVRQSFVVEMVGRDHVGNAVALNAMIFNSCRMAGPAAAGYLIGVMGTGWLFLLNAASLVAVILTLGAMNPDELIRADRRPRERNQFREGLRYVRGRPDLIVVLVLVFVVGTFGNTFNTTLAVLARNVFRLEADGFGLLHSMLAVGTFTGAMISAWRTRRQPKRSPRLFVLSALAFGVFEMVTALTPVVAACGAVLVLVGIAQMTFTLLANGNIQLSVDEKLRGRVMSLYMLLLLGGSPLGSMLSGWLAEHLSPRAPLLIGGGICALVALGVAVPVFGRRFEGDFRQGEASSSADEEEPSSREPSGLVR